MGSTGLPAFECGHSEQMESFADREGEGSGLELVHLSDVLDYLGVSDPVLRKLTRNQILNPTTTNEALTSLHSDNRDAFREDSVYIALVVGTAVLAVVLIIILLLVLTNMKKENSKFKTSPRKDFVTTFNR